ncbi:MAG: diacylglycerol kinase family lipid kinase [Eubacteriales bacterium]|nr:diacylglycerol kinase family lipid kinase [Eubacteriales bacterium]
MKVLLIANPSSGKLKLKQAIFDILTLLNAYYDEIVIRFTKERLHATAIIEETDLSEYELVICCGGDGTLNEVINGIMKSGKKCTLGYIPTGSTNDFATSIGIPTNIMDATSIICDGDRTKIDIGYFNSDRYFSYIASFGVFTAVSYNTQQAVKNVFGHLAYVLEGIKDISNIKTYHVLVNSSGNTYEGDYIFGAVTNSTSIGGIVKLPEAHVDFSDGLFEVILIKKPTNPNDLAKIIYGITNSNFDSDVFEFFKSSDMNFTFEEPSVWSLDGEACPTDNIVEIKSIREAVEIVL